MLSVEILFNKTYLEKATEPAQIEPNLNIAVSTISPEINLWKGDVEGTTNNHLWTGVPG